jgi:hypothetical protein
MTDYQTETAFRFAVTAEEAALMRDCLAIAAALEAGGPVADIPAPNAAFCAAFPRLDGDDDDWSGFRRIFSDADYADFGCDIEVADQEEGASVRVSGGQVDLGAVAELIRRCCPSALPLRFGWAATCSKYRDGAFGGGTIEISRFDIRDVIDDPQGDVLHVLASRDAEGSTLYWHEETGFGALADASVYTEAEAKRVTVIAADAPWWETLPCRVPPVHL